jgi:phosphatidate cytidylyltransferase
VSIQGPSIPLQSLTLLFLVIFFAGLALTLPLYSYSFKKLKQSLLFTKILFWAPIFAVFVGFLHFTPRGRAVVLGAIVAMALRDVIKNKQAQKHKKLAYMYLLCFAFVLAHTYLIGTSTSYNTIAALITVCFGSVLADVTAFFMGNYMGKHKLPAALNNKKSYEGVAGQLIGAGIGTLLVHLFVTKQIPLHIFVPIGIGSAAGDLANSYVKRRIGIAEWSQSIPGHGGYLDRFASLAGSFMFAYYWLQIF